MDHDTILTLLLGLTRKSSVHLIARDVFAEAAVSARHAWVFIPDLHLLSARSARRYKYSFGKNPSGPTRREGLLQELGEQLAPLTRAGSVSVIQLGDFADIWRENRAAPNADVAAMLRSILDDNPAAARFLADESRLGAQICLGNHDHVGDLSIGRVPATRRIRTAFALPPNGQIIATHGDAFDPVEDLPDPFSRWGSRFTETIGPGTKALRSARPVTRLSDIPARHGVKNNHRLLLRATQFADGLRRGHRGTLGRLGLRAARDVQIFVIGHTHSPSLVRGGTISVGRTQRRAVAIMDCGAWLEQSELPTGVVPSCHLGVIARGPGGTDLRLYQVTPR